MKKWFLRHITPLPDPPGPCRVHYPDGTTEALDLAYDGVVDGVEQWTAVQPIRHGGKISCDVLPPRSSVGFVMEVES